MKNVYLKLNESDIFYRFQNFKFYFSSEKIRERFINKVETYTEEEIIKLEIRYKVPISDSFKIFFAFSLYNKIEIRGFKVEQLLDERVVKRTLYELPKFEIIGLVGEE